MGVAMVNKCQGLAFCTFALATGLLDAIVDGVVGGKKKPAEAG
jgi:hypothetical protein